ncbi:hypothetical protein JEM51_11280 [Ligilactobacillus agilis]|uniref:hypothetical protein n=1 Tax=Ligilactobacillus agilis TaxID=1601 RepID=UPI00191F12D8|nr:hypothetical protein [Ligilactobacillus agilis]MBL1056977.1 hypothetical protein [Ligilactobacillus agilis]
MAREGILIKQLMVAVRALATIEVLALDLADEVEEGNVDVGCKFRELVGLVMAEGRRMKITIGDIEKEYKDTKAFCSDYEHGFSDGFEAGKEYIRTFIKNRQF